MITKQINAYCLDFTKIENYEKAVADETHIWHLHHRLETHFSDGTPRPYNAQITRLELKALGVYYNRPPEELIFLTASEHSKLHMAGKHHTEEHKRRIGLSNIGKRLGQRHSEDTKAKMREAHKRRKVVLF